MTKELASIMLLKNLLDTLPQGVFSMDMDGNIVVINTEALRLLGHSHITLIGNPLFDISPKFEKENIDTLLGEVKAAGAVKDREIQLYDVRGQLKRLKMSLSLLKNSQEEHVGIVAIIDDIRAKVLLEKEFEELQSFSQNILNSAGVGIIATDLKGDIVFASDGAKEVFKKPSEALIGDNIIKNSKKPLELNEKFMKLLETKRPFEYETNIETEEGVKNFINIFTLLKDSSGNPSGVIGVFKDISKLKSVADELKTSNRFLKRYSKNLESLIDITMTIGSSLDETEIHDNLVKAANKILDIDIACFFRYTKEHNKKYALTSIRGVGAHSILNLDLEMKYSGFYNFLNNLKSPKIVLDLEKETSLVVPSAFVEKKLKSGVFVPIQTKRKIGFLAVFSKAQKKFTKEEIDILRSIGSSGAIAIENASLYSKLKKLAEELEEKVKERTIELVEANRLKDLFIDIMSHDLLKPADIGRLSSELLMDMETKSDKLKIMENIRQGYDKIITLIENASKLAKLESGTRLEFKEDDLGKILQSVVSDISRSVDEKNMTLNIVANEQLPAVVNPLIYDVFSNLIGNAVKYGPAETEVNVEISDNGKTWRFTVSDSGQGIPDKYKKTIFDRFKRLEKGGVKGSGLGLAIVKRVITAHHGKVWVEDNPGGGSVFCAELPKVQDI